ncbi:hypothetical protein [Variovorax sp. UC122_21]|uniref:hypothetical protein n=1 Tax=Variovorax sp. UC122_21 TaxID=3374554 RepID=UPI00375743F3
MSIRQQVKTGGVPLSDAAAESIIARVNPPGTTLVVHGKNAEGPDITVRNAANAAEVTTVQVKSVANARKFEANLRDDLRKAIGPEGGSEIVAVQVPYGTSAAQLEGKLRNNFGNIDFTNRNILVVDQFGKIIIPLQPMQNFKKAP